MRICLILEGCYPYVYGGVSTWMHQYIQEMQEHEFVLWVVGACAKDKGKFVYELPGNVREVHEVFLDDALRVKPDKRKHYAFTPAQTEALKALMDCESPDWSHLFELYQKERMNPAEFLMSREFLEILTALCKEKYPYIAFADSFHTVRSMLLPVLYLLGQDVPEADVYHAIATGYGGMLAAMGHYVSGKPMFLTEHGIYTREREEEIIRAQWVVPSFKQQWIRFFYMLSDLAYKTSAQITSLFTNARNIQIEIGAEERRCRVIANGVDYERFSNIPLKEEDGWIDIGAVVRFAPIKDVKTMIYAFYELASRHPKIRLHIMGGVDDQEYAEECYAMVRQMELTNVIFTGRVNVVSYMEKLDFTILTSISEGQPLSVLESLAARRPCVTTDVGCCRELLEGASGDVAGAAGYCVPPMYREGLADAMEKMCANRRRRLRMGEIGTMRVNQYYRHERMLERYRDLYREVEADGRNRV